MARNRSRLTPWLYGALGLVAVAALVLGLPNIEEDLTDRAESALAAENLAADVDFDGRDATIKSDTLTPAEQQRAVTVVEDLRGVRTASFRLDDAAIDTPVTTTGAPTSTAGTTEPPTTAGTTTEAPPTTTTSTAPPADAPFLSVTLAEGALVLRGAIPDAAVAAQIAGVADLIYGPFVTNEIVVDEELAAAAWVSRSANGIAVLPIVGSATLELRDDVATVAALAPSEARSAQLQGALAVALGPDVEIDAAVGITGNEPPNFQANVPGDGTITLSGTVANQTVLERIVGSAIQLYGQENVTNNMVIGANTDANFSMYRVPVALVPLAAFSQWELDIQDDVITGALRGGATFASGSAQLTAELRALLEIGAGILLRNPTLGMAVEGHTDSVGSDATNQALSEARAAAAIEFLTAAGVDVSRLTGVGYGESRPIATNDTAAGRTLNRRVEFLLEPLPRGGG